MGLHVQDEAAPAPGAGESPLQAEIVPTKMTGFVGELIPVEIRLLFEELIARAPHIEQLSPPERLRSNFINGIKHLPVRLMAQ